ncbi:ParB/RepB/Spo0J family partition protein [Thalassospira sp.]|uniref:ParB/RepB/Spo0J family partition protein n=1 Tax=Thalassospira sp. TaxID=1912094 RepID=UPI000C4716D9|nr:ParB/RepB/Spo0J family partition protein [Thalassospira sp.]MAL38466.1 nuclease [Thalassospira sp.]|tara:strand:- start:2782 stop:3618 length:837 start_codon:yes stop_codon:yes gene_type:complete
MTAISTAPVSVHEEESLYFAPKKTLEKLRTEFTDEQTAGDLPTELPVSAIHEHSELFQPRGLDERHIQELRRAIRTQGILDPITVLQVGNKAVLIDGHHRRTAYKLEKVTKPVPVQYFQGSLEEAVLEAGRANSKAKLPMITSERQNYAWRLVLLGTYSKKQVCSASGISDGQVANMRRALKALGEEAYSYDTWAEARDAFNKRERDLLDDDEMAQWIEAQANDYADRMSREFGKKLSQNTTIAARALEIHFGRRLPDLIEALGARLPDDNEDEEDDF